MSKGSKRRLGKGFEDNYEKIFGSADERRQRSAIQEEARYAEAEGRRFRRTHEFKEFISPIDHTVITSPAKLRAHNKRHGVTNIRDYGEDWFKRKHIERSNDITGNTRQARNERIENVKEALQRHGVIRQ